MATIYQAGTLTTQTVYSDEAGTIPASNPIVADGSGFWPQRYVASPAKAVVTDSASAALYTLDPAPVSQASSSAAEFVSFTPTVDLPFANVQDAIEGAAALSASGFAAFGIGITGNATVLAALDATGTGAGVYRFDGTTTGTYPTGVLAADLGLVEVWRQAANVAIMELHHATSNRKFRRRLTAGVWGTWRENIEVNQGAVQGDIIYRGASDWTRLAKGTSGQVLTQNAGLTAPEWATPVVAGTQTLFQTLAVGSGATCETNTFNSGKNYIFDFSGVRHNAGANRALEAAMFGATDAAYTAAASTGVSIATTFYMYGRFFLLNPSVSRKNHLLSGGGGDSATASGTTSSASAASGGMTANFGVAQTVTKIRFSWASAASFNGGNILIYEY